MSKPRALVTGGAGFVGSHLCDALLADDANFDVTYGKLPSAFDTTLWTTTRTETFGSGSPSSSRFGRPAAHARINAG